MGKGALFLNRANETLPKIIIEDEMGLPLQRPIIILISTTTNFPFPVAVT